MTTPMRIAMVGTRGVPANYGGFETCVEEVGARLAAKGHEVTVYCRSSYFDERQDEHKGMKLMYLPSIKKKSLDTFSHTVLTSFHAAFQRYDAVLAFNAANAPFLTPLKLAGKRIGLNTDGLEWQRDKWGRLGRAFYRFSEKYACVIANRLVSDSTGIHDYYAQTHGVDSSTIAYGAFLQHSDPAARQGVLEQYGLEPGKYFLQITRFEPENHPLETIRAFNALDASGENDGYKLVLVGGTPYATEYSKQMEAEAGENVVLPGFIYDADVLRELWCNTHAYVHGNSVGGTNPALLQTMASGCFVIASDVRFNQDVLAQCGVFYDRTAPGLVEQMRWSVDHAGELDVYRDAARERIEQFYNWDVVADQYETLCDELRRGQHPWRPAFSTFLSWTVDREWFPSSGAQGE